MVSIGDQLELKRSDLLDFKKETVDLILEMQKDGWRGHRNKQGHVAMLPPDGERAVMATSNTNAYTYLRQGLNRSLERSGKKEAVTTPTPKTVQKWPCARPGCPKVFNSEENLNHHIHVDHEGMLPCPNYPECKEYFKRPASLGLHRANKHGYVSPTKAKRDATKKKKKEKVVLDKVVEDLEEKPNVTEEDPSVSVDVASYETTEALDATFVRAYADGDIGISITANQEINDAIEHVDFYDERDSWTVDDPDMMAHSVNTLRSILNAVGLDMEIRVWRK
jgi:hypothetical protein